MPEEKRHPDLIDPIDLFQNKLKGVKFTFSINCCKGLVGASCECCRCRQARGQVVSKNTERRARAISKYATEQFHKTINMFVD